MGGRAQRRAKKKIAKERRRRTSMAQHWKQDPRTGEFVRDYVAELNESSTCVPYRPVTVKPYDLVSSYAYTLSWTNQWPLWTFPKPRPFQLTDSRKWDRDDWGEEIAPVHPPIDFPVQNYRRDLEAEAKDRAAWISSLKAKWRLVEDYGLGDEFQKFAERWR